jgi:hypothetical protein
MAFYQIFTMYGIERDFIKMVRNCKFLVTIQFRIFSRKTVEK